MLNAFAGDVARDGGVVGLARYLVDLVDVDDAHLRLLDVVIAFLKELLDDVLDIFTDITRFGKCGGIGDGKWHVQQSREGLGEQRLTAAGGTDQQNVTLIELDFVLLAFVVQTFVVVVHSHREHLLGMLLSNDVLVENRLDFVGGWEP